MFIAPLGTSILRPDGYFNLGDAVPIEIIYHHSKDWLRLHKALHLQTLSFNGDTKPDGFNGSFYVTI